jgi:pilus assembly protein CpaC
VTIRPAGRILGALLALALATATAAPLSAQRVVRDPTQAISIAKGASFLLVNPVNIQRWAIGDPGIAEAISVSATELLINARSVGTTSIFIWDNNGAPRLYSVQVTADAEGLQRYLKQLLPNEEIQVDASGNTVTLTGTLKDPNSVARAVEVARTTGASIIDNLIAPPAVQVLLQVRFAEVNLSALRQWGVNLDALNPHQVSDGGNWQVHTVSDGVVQVLLSNPNANIGALINASISKGDLRTLAEPNLMTLPGKEASFLAGGEFPYPTLQSNQSNGVTVTFKEFGIKLKFTPNIARNGAIRLKVAPEVSSLDFANGLSLNGFVIPALLTRRAETEVELNEGQWLALAGLIDNQTIRNVTKVPLLGDIPILGQFFRSTSKRQNRTELLVLITPHLVKAVDTPPLLPTGEPNTWNDLKKLDSTTVKK